MSDSLKHVGESLVEYCRRAYEYDQRTCDNFHSLFIRRPYTYKGMKKSWAKDCFPNMTITRVLKESQLWRDYVVKSVHYGTDCSINVFAERPCKTVNDLIYYYGHSIDNNCIFKEIFSNTEYKLDYVKMHDEEFENTVYVKEVDVNKDKKIICVHYMKNNGN